MARVWLSCIIFTDNCEFLTSSLRAYGVLAAHLLCVCRAFTTRLLRVNCVFTARAERGGCVFAVRFLCVQRVLRGYRV